MTINELTPWYKQFWPWFLMALPASAVVAGIVTIVIAITNPDGLVKDDYYKAGLGINRTLEREKQAAALGLHAGLEWQPDAQQVMLQLSAEKPFKSERLLLHLIHPTRSGLDIRIPLQHQGNNRYRGLLAAKPAAGNWYLIITPEDESWRLNGRARLPEQTTWELTP
ncbi:MAG: FixH family protein [Halobacteria archaeon]|nr:FixH family protein [Halobacteria archaeon]